MDPMATAQFIYPFSYLFNVFNIFSHLISELKGKTESVMLAPY